MIILLMAVDRADSAVFCLGRRSFLYIWLSTGSVDSTGRKNGIKTVNIIFTVRISEWSRQ